MTPPRFEPFQDRLSRDIRNELSAALPPALARNDLAPVLAVAGPYLQKGLAWGAWRGFPATVQTRCGVLLHGLRKEMILL